MILSGLVIGGNSLTCDSAISGAAPLTSAAARSSAPPAIAARRVGNRSPSRRPRSTTPSPTTAPYELRPESAKLISFISQSSLLIPQRRLILYIVLRWGAPYNR